jgi:RNA ligase
MEHMMKELLNIGIEHPARVMEFTELTQGLFAEVADGNVSVTYHPEFPHLALFKYTQDCVTERKWNKFSLMARGLILDLQDKKVVAVSFTKFFNYGEIEEGSRSIIEPDFLVTEKMDGSLGIMYFFADQFRFATAGSFISEQAQWADQWAKEHIAIDKLDKTSTYLFEIIYHENKIVVHYNFEGLVLLSIFNSYGLECNYEQIKWEASYMGTRYVKQYNFEDMETIVNTAKTLDSNNEGYVIRFKSGIRLKIKGDEYVRVHRLISQVTPLAIWESMVNGDDLEGIKKDLPEEMEKDFDTIRAIFNAKLEAFIKEVESLCERTKSMSDKELGIYMQQGLVAFGNTVFKDSFKFIFHMRKNKFYESLNDVPSYGRRRIFAAFRPKANILEGYKPSSVVNRFANMDN